MYTESYTHCEVLWRVSPDALACGVVDGRFIECPGAYKAVSQFISFLWPICYSRVVSEFLAEAGCVPLLDIRWQIVSKMCPELYCSFASMHGMGGLLTVPRHC